MAKAGSWTLTTLRHEGQGERKGLDTPVVLAVNGARFGVRGIDPLRAGANALSVPGEYGRKIKTQRN